MGGLLDSKDLKWLEVAGSGWKWLEMGGGNTNDRLLEDVRFGHVISDNDLQIIQ